MANSRYDKELPWGSWLRVVISRHGVTTIVDDDGGEWPTVRDCFWGKRLSMSRAIPKVRDEQLELMLMVLASIERQVVRPPESIHEVFKSDLFFRFYYHWLHSIGLIDGGHLDSPLDPKPNAEGVAVIRMLLATRPVALQGIPVGPAAVKLFGKPGTEAECDRERYAAAEGKARSLPFAFVRETLCGRPCISGLYRDLDSNLPMIRTVWTQTFAHERSRDRIFDWMWARLDRWSAWGERARGYGGAALTEHLFSLIVLNEGRTSDPDDGAPARLAITHKP